MMVVLQDAHREPIIPNKWAVGFSLGITLKAVEEFWSELLTIEQIATDHVHWEYLGIGLWFNANKLDQIGLQGSYQGKTKKHWNWSDLFGCRNCLWCAFMGWYLVD